MKELNKFIFFSSGSLYSPSKNKIKESSKIKLNNNYKTVKYFGEKSDRLGHCSAVDCFKSGEYIIAGFKLI